MSADWLKSPGFAGAVALVALMSTWALTRTKHRHDARRERAFLESVGAYLVQQDDEVTEQALMAEMVVPQQGRHHEGPRGSEKDGEDDDGTRDTTPGPPRGT